MIALSLILALVAQAQAPAGGYGKLFEAWQKADAPQPPAAPWWSADGWSVYRNQDNCVSHFAASLANRSPSRLILFVRGQAPKQVLTLSNDDWSTSEGQKLDVLISFDRGERAFSQEALGTNSHSVILPVDDGFLADLAASGRLVAGYNGKVLATFDLKGSARAMAQLKACFAAVERIDELKAKIGANDRAIEQAAPRDPFSAGK